MNTSEPLTLSVREAGELLGIGRNSVYAMVKDGHLPVLRLGEKQSHIRIPRKAVVALVERAAGGEE